MAENINDRNFIPTFCIADNVPTTWSGKRRTFTVTTHRISKWKPQGKIFKCGQCGEKFNIYNLMKAHEKLHAPGGQVEYKCNQRGCNKMFSTKGGLRQHIRQHGGQNCNVHGKVFFYLIELWQNTWKHMWCRDHNGTIVQGMNVNQNLGPSLI